MSCGFGLGFSLRQRVGGGGGGDVTATRGPELAPAFTSWGVSGTGVAVDGTGITFSTGSTTSSFCNVTGIATEDNATYEIQVTIANFTAGNVVIRVYGATSVHTGISSALNANGSSTFQVTCNGAGSPTQQLRVTAGVGNTALKVTALSVKKVLA
jgi:hypothetical protein